MVPAWGQQEAEKERKKPRKNKKDTSAILAQPMRLEIPIDDLRDDFEVVDGNEEGLLVAQNTRENVIPNGNLWHFRLVNNDLEIKWKVDQIIDVDAELVAYDYSIGFYFLLFEIRNTRDEYKTLVIDAESGIVLGHEFETPFEMELNFFEALDNGILLVGQYNNRPVALIHDLVSNRPQVLSGFYNHNEHVFDVVMDEKKRAFSVVLAERMRNGKYTNRIKTFTYDGLLVLENLIHPGENLNLVDGTTTNFMNGIQYMVGTYSVRTSNFSRGIYISKFVNGQQRFLHEHNYGDFNNFFAYRGDRAARRIARRVERKKAKGKTPKFNYNLFIHDIIQKGELSIVIAEAYYAKYSSNPNAYRRYYGSPYSLQPFGPPSNFQSFLGYKFTHAIIVAFDSNGNIVWDNSFKTNDITSYNLQESVAVNIQGEKAVIAYLDNAKIKSKVIEGNDVLEGKTYNPVKLMYPGDKLTSASRDTEIKGVRNWYSNYLFSYGAQRIKNKSLPREERRRKVFYLNKLEFETDVELNDDYPITFKGRSMMYQGASSNDY